MDPSLGRIVAAVPHLRAVVGSDSAEQIPWYLPVPRRDNLELSLDVQRGLLLPTVYLIDCMVL